MPVFDDVIASGVFRPGVLSIVDEPLSEGYRVGVELDTALQVPRRLLYRIEFGLGSAPSDWVCWLSYPCYSLRSVSMLLNFHMLKPALYFSDKQRELDGVMWNLSIEV